MITLECSYQKKVGLRQYSSHQLDSSLLQPGFLPGPNTTNQNANGKAGSEAWGCSEKQKDLILKLVEENHLDNAAVEQLAQHRFGKAVRALNRLESAGLIDALIEQTGGNNRNQRRRYNGRSTPVSTR